MGNGAVSAGRWARAAGYLPRIWVRGRLRARIGERGTGYAKVSLCKNDGLR